MKIKMTLEQTAKFFSMIEGEDLWQDTRNKMIKKMVKKVLDFETTFVGFCSHQLHEWLSEDYRGDFTFNDIIEALEELQTQPQA